MQRVLVTGATGFLGSALIHDLVAKNIEVIAVGRNPEKCAALTAQGFQTICHDLSLPFPAIHDLGPIDAIVHCAALSSATGPRAAFERANVTATRRIVDLAKARHIKRFVHISSPTVYFKLADAIMVPEETLLPNPINHYAATKQASEKIVMLAPEIGPVILRPRGLYGPNDTTLLPQLLQAARRPLPLFHSGRACIDLTYIDDVVAAIRAVLNAGPQVTNQVFNISGGEVLPIRDIVDQTCNSFGTTPRWRPLPFGPILALARLLELTTNTLPFVPPSALTPYTLGLFAYAQSLDISKAQNMLGWRPQITFSEGLRRTCAARGQG